MYLSNPSVFPKTDAGHILEAFTNLSTFIDVWIPVEQLLTETKTTYAMRDATVQAWFELQFKRLVVAMSNAMEA